MIRIEMMQNAFVFRAVEIDPTHRDGDDLRSRRFDRLDHLRVGGVLSGPNHEARAELVPGDHEWLRIGERNGRQQFGVRHQSAPADEVDDLDRIARGQLDGREGGTIAQNGSVVFDYDRARVEVERSQ